MRISSTGKSVRSSESPSAARQRSRWCSRFSMAWVMFACSTGCLSSYCIYGQHSVKRGRRTVGEGPGSVPGRIGEAGEEGLESGERFEWTRPMLCQASAAHPFSGPAFGARTSDMTLITRPSSPNACLRESKIDATNHPGEGNRVVSC